MALTKEPCFQQFSFLERGDSSATAAVLVIIVTFEHIWPIKLTLLKLLFVDSESGDGHFK